MERKGERDGHTEIQQIEAIINRAGRGGKGGIGVCIATPDDDDV